jgi:hypothetical protein
MLDYKNLCPIWMNTPSSKAQEPTKLRFGTMLWYEMPLVIGVVSGVVALVVLLALWFCLVRPAVNGPHRMQDVNGDRPLDEARLRERELTQSVSLLVLEWSDDLDRLVHKALRAKQIRDSASVSVYYKHGFALTTTLRTVSAKVDSVWDKANLQRNETVSLSSLSTVLRTGFQGAKNSTDSVHQIVIVGRFPRLPGQRELTQRKNDPILATADYEWIVSAKQRYICFVTLHSGDEMRRQLEKALTYHGLFYDNYTE